MFFKTKLKLDKNWRKCYCNGAVKLCVKQINKILQESANEIELKVSSKKRNGYSPLKLYRCKDSYFGSGDVSTIYYSIKNAERPRGQLLMGVERLIIAKTGINECETINLYFKIRKIS